MLMVLLDKKADLEERALAKAHPGYATYLMQVRRALHHLAPCLVCASPSCTDHPTGAQVRTRLWSRRRVRPGPAHRARASHGVSARPRADPVPTTRAHSLVGAARRGRQLHERSPGPAALRLGISRAGRRAGHGVSDLDVRTPRRVMRMHALAKAPRPWLSGHGAWNAQYSFGDERDRAGRECHYNCTCMYRSKCTGSTALQCGVQSSTEVSHRSPYRYAPCSRALTVVAHATVIVRRGGAELGCTCS